MEEKRIAIKAAKAMDLKVAGVDIIRSAKGPAIRSEFVLGLEE
jgi:ribosomal protein S6--L-glutamate ligase